MSFKNSCSESVVMSALRSKALRRVRFAGARSASAAANAGSISSTSSISTRSKKPVQLLDVALIKIELGHRARDLGVGQHANLLAAFLGIGCRVAGRGAGSRLCAGFVGKHEPWSQVIVLNWRVCSTELSVRLGEPGALLSSQGASVYRVSGDDGDRCSFLPSG